MSLPDWHYGSSHYLLDHLSGRVVRTDAWTLTAMIVGQSECCTRLPRPRRPSCVTLRPASLFANSSLQAKFQSAARQVRPNSMPAIKVSPAPTVLLTGQYITAPRGLGAGMVIETHSTALDASTLKAGHFVYFWLGNSRAATPDSPQVQSNKDALRAKVA